MADSKRPEAEDGFGVHLNMMLLGCLSCIKYLLFLYYSSLSIEYFSLPFRLQFSTYFWFFPVHQPIGDAVATTFPICVQKATTICKYLSSLLRTNIFTLKNMGWRARYRGVGHWIKGCLWWMTPGIMSKYPVPLPAIRRRLSLQKCDLFSLSSCQEVPK